jgi:pimeloyl-ACP methyl ester carboxylesterase
VIAALPGVFRIVTTSLLGYGDTAERRAGTDVFIEREAEILEAVVLHTGGPLHLVGHSYGGQACLAVAIRKVVELTSLTIIEPTAFPILRHTGDLALYEEVATMHAAYVRAFEAGDEEAARRVVDFFGGKGTFDALPERMRDYVVTTTACRIFLLRTAGPYIWVKTEKVRLEHFMIAFHPRKRTLTVKPGGDAGAPFNARASFRACTARAARADS